MRIKARGSLQSVWSPGEGPVSKWVSGSYSSLGPAWSSSPGVSSLVLRDKMGRVGLARGWPEESREESRRR